MNLNCVVVGFIMEVDKTQGFEVKIMCLTDWGHTFGNILLSPTHEKEGQKW